MLQIASVIGAASASGERNGKKCLAGVGWCRRTGGFTLIELMITLAVAAILLTLGTPSFTDLIQNNRVASQTNELVAALNLGRSEAVKRGRQVQVEVAAAALEAGGSWSATVSVVDGDELRVVDYDADGMTLTGAATVTFAPTGVADSAPVFTMQPKGCPAGKEKRQGQIAVARSGQITVTRVNCS